MVFPQQCNSRHVTSRHVTPRHVISSHRTASSTACNLLWRGGTEQETQRRASPNGEPTVESDEGKL